MRTNRAVLRGISVSICVSLLLAWGALCQEPEKPSTPVPVPGEKRPPLPEMTERQDLQKAIDDAGNDRAALVKNLEAFLKKYPQSSQRPQIYRALVESSMQLRDFTKAVDYSERLVSLNPEDISNTILTIQLLDRYGDAPGYRRAVFYCSRVMEYIEHTPQNEKSPRVSPEDWENSKRKDRSSLLLIRGELYQKLNDLPNAQNDFQASFALVPSATAADQLGELAERKEDWKTAIQEYARAFALADATSGAVSRVAMRKKLGNVWKLAHGTEDGLGDYLLHAFDETTELTAAPKAPRNPNGKEPYDFVLRSADGGTTVRLGDDKGKVVVLSFWATWCGPCRELEPHLERVAARYQGKNDVLFYALNCDDDESLVGPFLKEEKPKIPALFADGLERLLNVDSFPTTVVLDRAGKIAFRENGYDADEFEKSLVGAIERVTQPASEGTPTAAVKP